MNPSRAKNLPAPSLDAIGEPLPGSISEQFIRGGKPTCRCRRGQPHGPYYYRVWREGQETDGQVSKVHKVYVKAADVAGVRARCEECRVQEEHLRALLARHRALRGRLRVQILRSGRFRLLGVPAAALKGLRQDERKLRSGMAEDKQRDDGEQDNGEQGEAGRFAAETSVGASRSREEAAHQARESLEAIRAQEGAGTKGTGTRGDLPPQDGPRWEELRERVGDGLAAAREILKDSGSVVAWSRALRGEASTRRAEAALLRAEAAALRVEARALHGQETENEAEAAGGEGAGEARAVEVQRGERAVVVRMLDALDLITSVPLSQVLRSLAAPSAEDSGDGWECGRVVAVDLRAAPFLDAAGLRALAEGRKALRDAGRGLVVLVRPGSQPARVLEACGLCRFLPCLESLDELPGEQRREPGPAPG